MCGLRMLRAGALIAMLVPIALPAHAQPMPQQAPSALAACAALTDGPLERIDPAQAVPACDAALMQMPNDPHLLVKIGRALQAGKAFDRAFAAYEASARQGNAVAMHNIGTLYGGFGSRLDAAEAGAWYERAAKLGNTDSMVNLGYLLAEGIGGPRDDAKAAGWFRQAAEAGNSFGMYNIGVMSLEGRGVSRDATQAAGWFRKAADLGHAGALFNLGLLTAEGRGGVSRNQGEAVELYRKAAAGGSAPAMVNLGMMLVEGRGVEPDDNAAAEWFRKAAEAGDAKGMTRYAFMLQNGRGVAKDIEQAKVWYRKAIELGNITAKYNLGRLEGKPQPGDGKSSRGSRSEAGANANFRKAQTLLPNGCRGGGYQDSRGNWRCR